MDHRLTRMILRFLFATVLISAMPWPAAAQEKSVKPGINETWKSNEIQPLINTLEAESREIFTQRAKLADLLALRPGMAVADVARAPASWWRSLPAVWAPAAKCLR